MLAAALALALLLVSRSFAFPDAPIAPRLCRACHLPAPGKGGGAARPSEGQRKNALKKVSTLLFTRLLAKEYEPVKAGEVYSLSAGGEGKVMATHVLFRDNRGRCLRCEIGRHFPKGSVVLLGDRAYRMQKGSGEWVMRRVDAVNGIPVGGEVFIAESFVKAAERAASPPSRKPAPETAAADAAEMSGRERPLPAVKKHTPDLREVTAREATGNVVVMKNEEDRYEVVSTLGELTVHHTFRGHARITVHEVYFASYPRVYLQEIFNVPLAEVKKNSDRFLRGYDGTLGAKMLSAVHRELNPLFDTRIGRRLPSPDERVVTGMRLVGDDFMRYIYVDMTDGQGVPLTDALLIKIIRSEPASPHDKDREGEREERNSQQ